MFAPIPPKRLSSNSPSHRWCRVSCLPVRGSLMRIFIIGENLKDLQIAADAARSTGFNDIEAFVDVDPAMSLLKRALRGESPLPYAVILDLNQGPGNGYELVRFWHSTRTQANIKMIVWSGLDERNREMCSLFGVDLYVCKWEGERALREALQRLNPSMGN
jgi:DNA-binding response OmpR family regulator